MGFTQNKSTHLSKKKKKTFVKIMLFSYLQESDFIFSPNNGELRPLEEFEVFVMYNPRKCCSLRTVFELSVVDGNQR